MNPKLKRAKALQEVLTRVEAHLAVCEICQVGGITPQTLAWQLKVKDHGLIKQALNTLVLRGQLSRLYPGVWRSTRTRYIFRHDQSD